MKMIHTIRLMTFFLVGVLSSASMALIFNGNSAVDFVNNYPAATSFTDRPHRLYVTDFNGDRYPDFKIVFVSTVGQSMLSHVAPIVDGGLVDSHNLIRILPVDARNLTLNRTAKQGAPGDVSKLFSQLNTLFFTSSDSGEYNLTDINPCLTRLCEWRPIGSRIFYSDINGDQNQDFLLVPNSMPNSAYNPSFSVIAGAFTQHSTRPGYLMKETARVAQVIDLHYPLLSVGLSDLPTIQFKDVDSDGLADIVGWLNEFSSDGALYARGRRDGSFKRVEDLKSLDIASLTSVCGHSISVPLRASEYYESEECDSLYVTPPSSGFANVSNVNLHSNILMCEGLDSTFDNILEASKRILALEIELSELTLSLLDSEELTFLRASHNVAEIELKNRRFEKENAEKIHKRALGNVADIQEDVDDGFSDESELAEAIEALDDAQEVLDAATFDHLSAVLIAEETADNLQLYFEEHLNEHIRITGVINNLFFLNEQRRALVNEIGELEGGVVQLSLLTYWSDLVEDFWRQNRGLKSHIKKMPIQSSRLLSGLSEASANEAGILWTRLLDAKNQENYSEGNKYGAIIQGDANRFSLPNFENVNQNNESKDSYMAEMAVALKLMCSYYPDGVSTNIPRALNQIPSMLTLNLKQNYTVKSNTGYRYSYNLGKLAQYMFNFVLSDGHFREGFRRGLIRNYLVERRDSWWDFYQYTFNEYELRRYIHSLNESDWFTIRFVDDNYTLAQQEQMRTDLKRSILDTVLSATTTEYSMYRQGVQDGKRPSKRLISVTRLKRYIANNINWKTDEALLPQFVNRVSHTDFLAVEPVSTTDPSAVVTSSSSSPSYVGANAFDGENRSMWISQVNDTPAWIQYNFGSRTRVKKYTIIYSNGRITTRAPKHFTLQGSNNGTRWVVIDSRFNEINWSGLDQRSYFVRSPGDYSYYRLVVTDDNDSRAGVVVISIGELFFE